MMTHEQLFQEDLARREERIKTRTIGKLDYTIRCHDPYGFWKVETGNVLPKELQGQYTSEEGAWRAIEAYESSRPVPQPKTILSTDGKGGRKRIPVEEFTSED